MLGASTALLLFKAGVPRKALRGGIQKSILTDCSGNLGDSREMLTKTGQRLQERGRDTPTKGLSWITTAQVQGLGFPGDIRIHNVFVFTCAVSYERGTPVPADTQPACVGEGMLWGSWFRVQGVDPEPETLI